MLKVSTNIDFKNGRDTRLLTAHLPLEIENFKYKLDDTDNSIKNDSNTNDILSSSDNNQTIANYQPSISDQIKVGFYSCDRCTQTEESDILVLNEATENLVYLCREIDVVKYDLKFAKNSIENRFDCELNSKSIEIYGMINEKFNEIKKQQEKNIERIRGAYRSQLANAIIKINKFVEEQNKEVTNDQNIDSKSVQNYLQTIKELKRVIAEQDFKIKDMKEKADDNLERINFENELSLKSLKEERERAYQEVNNCNKKLKRLEEALNIKEEESEKILSELTNLQLQIEKEKIQYDQISKEFQEFKQQSENEKQKLKKEFDKQKIALETKMHEKLKESREQLVNAAKQELKQQQQQQLEQQQQLMEQQQQQQLQQQKLLKEQQEKQKQLLQQQEMMLQKARQEKEKEIEMINRERMEKEANLHASMQEQLSLAEALQQERERELLIQQSKYSRKEDLELISKLKNNEFYFKSEISRLNREINRNNEQWEKKFDILKHSLHAIKDEMYLRQNLQKQSVQLAYASIAYTMDEPPSLQQQFPKNENSNSSQNDLKTSKPILPSIGKKGIDRPLSMTISVPSRLSGQMENDEAQIIDDEEMNKFKEEFMDDIDFIPAKEA